MYKNDYTRPVLHKFDYLRAPDGQVDTTVIEIYFDPLIEAMGLHSVGDDDPRV